MRNAFVRLVLLIIVYVIFAFCAWHFNPALWVGFWRFLCIVCMIGVLVRDID